MNKTPKYSIPAKPTFYNNIQFRSRLEAKWACFFDLIKWQYTYEPIDLEKWSPDFKITTENGTRFLVEVKPEIYADNTLFLKVGNATDYSGGILIVSESPFKYPYPNCIGLTSVFGKTKNHKDEESFEFCTSVIMDLFGQGNDIYNLCESNDMVIADFKEANDFCTELWNKACNQVQFLKPIN